MKTFAVKLIAVVATFIVTFCIIHTAMNHKKQFEPETIESETISDILAALEESEPVELISEPESTTVETTTEATTESTTISETTEYYEEDEPEQDYDSSSHGSYIGEFQLTAYEWTGNPMANGEYPYYGACASNKFALGTVLYIDGYGTFVVCDRGGMADNIIDIYLGDPEECDEFGRKFGVDVYYAD